MSHRLPFPVPEAPDGWVMDLGATMTRAAMVAALAAPLAGLERARSVHSHLAAALSTSGGKTSLLRGTYLRPGKTDQFMHLVHGMPMDAWVNSGCMVHDDGNYVLAHLCLKTARTDLPTDAWLAWALPQLVDKAQLPLDLGSLMGILGNPDISAFVVDWHEKNRADVKLLTQGGGYASAELSFWQAQRAIQEAAAALRAGKPPEVLALQPDWNLRDVTELPPTLADVLGTL